ncbi:thiamine pyrophosphate-binding protein [Streptomyces sp. NPDC035033]|uniref:thiamine pyrophosphate-binding protein n=1 Tax=Streptomyces sp. NPDC035033 TaxID=3155368 RepID=UPI0033F7EE9C
MKVYQRFAEALLEHGFDTVFGLMGDANMLYLCDYAERGGRFVPAVHEGGAVGMADGWSRAGGRVGVASVTHGPAVTNTMTALTEAVRSRSRVLLVTGDTPAEPTHFQRLDLAAVAAAAGAGYERVGRPGDLVRMLDRAVQRVVAEDRPVVLDLPFGLLRQEADAPRSVARPRPRAAALPPSDRLDAALRLMSEARRPVILAGRGAVAADARDELVALGEKLAAPLATTLLAKDWFRDHPSDLGVFGGLSHRAAAAVIDEADCVVAFGAGLHAHTTGHGALLKGKKVVQVDADPGAFGWFTRVDEAVPGDARAVAAAMGEALWQSGHTPDESWLAGVRLRLGDHRPGDGYQDRTDAAAGTVDVRTAALRLDRLLPRRRVLVSDIGRFALGVWPHLRVADARDFLCMGGFGSIGLGLAGAVGAAVARPDDLTVLVVGDGGFMMNVGEFTTAVRERLPLLVVVLNDGAYGAEHVKLARLGVDPDRSLTAWPDPVPLAEAMGGRGLTVRRPEDLDVLRERTRSLDGPLLVDVRLDPRVDVVP